MPSSEKKFTFEELLAGFRLAVSALNPAELEELRAWLERVTRKRLETADQLALTWLKVTARHYRDRIDRELLELEEPSQAPAEASKHLAEFSPPPRDRRN